VPETQHPRKEHHWLWIALAFPIGLLTGILGIGGGVFVVPILVMVLGFGMRNAVATFGTTFATFVCPLAMILVLALGTASLLSQIAAGEMNRRDWIELGSYIVVGLILLMIFSITAPHRL
jgi:uncharacterized membrane protein YfcA